MADPLRMVASPGVAAAGVPLGLSHIANVSLVDKLESQAWRRLRRVATGGAAAQPADGALPSSWEQPRRPARGRAGAARASARKLNRTLATNDQAVSYFCRLCDFTSCPVINVKCALGDEAYVGARSHDDAEALI
jgi:hypothetical protein